MEYHDKHCPARESKHNDCICLIIEMARAEGYEAAMRETSWECGDCGNTYDYTVTECPNRILDEIAVAKR